MCERNITTIKHPAVAVSSSTSTAMTGIALTAPHSSSLLNQQATNSHHHHHHHSNTNNQHQGYASSTLSSTTSSHNHNTNQLYQSKKKSISPIIAESIKASASLSASNTTAELFDSPNSPVSKNQIIRMIDTDNEDNNTTTNANDVSNDSSDLPIRLDKLDEEEQKQQQQQQTLDTSMSAVYEKNMHPPSFKTALSSRPLFSSNFNSSSNHQSSEFRHQYQNDIDLNIHPSTLPKIVQHTQ